MQNGYASRCELPPHLQRLSALDSGPHSNLFESQSHGIHLVPYIDVKSESCILNFKIFLGGLSSQRILDPGHLEKKIHLCQRILRVSYIISYTQILKTHFKNNKCVLNLAKY